MDEGGRHSGGVAPERFAPLRIGQQRAQADAKRRAALGREAAAFIHQERSLDAAAQRLGKLLAAL